ASRGSQMTVKPHGLDTTNGTAVTSAAFAPTRPRANEQNHGLQGARNSGISSVTLGEWGFVMARRPPGSLKGDFPRYSGDRGVTACQPPSKAAFYERPSALKPSTIRATCHP